MSNNDLNKTLADILNNMDKKTLQDNLGKALDVLKNANTEELAKQISNVCGGQQGAKANNPEKASLDKMNINPDAIKNLSSTDIEKMLKQIGSHGDEIKGKLKDIIK
ncbi:MAG: hypothetical protein N2489_04655 [Clostridia bacterium]|nr:hypothetical protein [Clostridia bacterium]